MNRSVGHRAHQALFWASAAFIVGGYWFEPSFYFGLAIFIVYLFTK